MTLAQGLTLLLLIWNAFVFLVYGLDKGKARKNLYRIPEKTLLSMTYLFGGLGACLAGYFFHHKTRRWYFVLAWFVGIVIDAGILYLIWRDNGWTIHF